MQVCLCVCTRCVSRYRTGRVMCRAMCVCVIESFIQHTFLKHLLCVHHWAWAGNTEEDWATWSSESSRSPSLCEAFPGHSGEGQPVQGAGILPGSHRAVWAFWRAGPKTRPSPGAQQPPTRLPSKAPLFPSPTSLITDQTPQGHRRESYSAFRGGGRTAQGPRFPEEVHKISQSSSRLRWPRTTIPVEKAQQAEPIWAATHLFTGGTAEAQYCHFLLLL